MLKQRVLTALLLAPIVIFGVLKLPIAGFALAVALVFGFGFWEWTRLCRIESSMLRVGLSLIPLLAMAALWRMGSPSMFRWIAAAGVLWWLIAVVWLRQFDFGSRFAKGEKALKLIAGVITIVPAWCAAVTLIQIPNGRWVFLFVLVLIWVADSCAYFAGRKFGTTKLAPRISPGKTTQGLYGALLGSAVFAALVGWQWQQPVSMLWKFVLLAIAVVMMSVIGDLFESLMKRHAGMKDSGQLLPGHGGVLDRFDSLFAALPVFATGLWCLGL